MMTCVVGRRLMVFCRISAVGWCSVVGLLVICGRAFARMLTA